MSEKKTNEERQKEVDRQLQLMKAAIGDDIFSDDSDSDTSGSEQLKERKEHKQSNYKKDAMESARQFLWDEADDDNEVMLGGPFPKSAANGGRNSGGGLSASLFGAPKDDDTGVDQTINLMDASEARVRPSRKSDNRPSPLTTLFSRATQSTPSWNDAAPSRDHEEFIEEKRRGYRSLCRKIGLLALWIVALLSVAGVAYYAFTFVADSLADNSDGGTIEDKLVESGLLDPALLDIPNSPQAQALEWITTEDPAQLSPNDDFLSQRYALAVLFFSTAGSTSWTNAEYWLTDRGYCLWYGVECVGESDYVQLDGNAQVFQLNLTQNQLQGTVPTELTAFTGLFLLDLQDNALTGTLPVLSFSILRGLSLANNQLAGSIPSQLLEVNSELRALDLSNNSFYSSIPPAIGAAINLRELRLDHNDLTGSIPPSIYALTSLEDLHLNSNQLTGSLPDSFYNLHRLETLHLHENTLTGAISSQLAKLSHLELLSLNNNQLQGTVPDIFGNILLLEELHLYDNALTGTMPNTVCELRKEHLHDVSVDCVTSAGDGVICGCCTQCL
jgi:hypothetical protein